MGGRDRGSFPTNCSFSPPHKCCGCYVILRLYGIDTWKWGTVWNEAVMTHIIYVCFGWQTSSILYITPHRNKNIQDKRPTLVCWWSTYLYWVARYSRTLAIIKIIHNIIIEHICTCKYSSLPKLGHKHCSCIIMLIHKPHITTHIRTHSKLPVIVFCQQKHFKIRQTLK